MKGATRPACHVDRAACAWLILRFIDPAAEFLFVEDADDIPTDATAFDVPGTALSHHGRDCTFETMVAYYRLADQAITDVAAIVHEADLADDRFDAPEAAGLDVIIRGMSLVLGDQETLRACLPLFDGLLEYRRRANEFGTIPS